MLSSEKTTAFARDRHASTFRDWEELNSSAADIGSKKPVLSKEQDAHLVFLSGILLYQCIINIINNV